MSKKKDGFIDSLRQRSYFFDKGVRFQCTQCGICCTGEPGIVYIDQDEAWRIASYLEIPIDVLTERMIDPFKDGKDGYTAREAEGGRCIFYENGCVIYPVRPIQCMTFPLLVSEHALCFRLGRCIAAMPWYRTRPSLYKGRDHIHDTGELPHPYKGPGMDI